MIESKRRSAMRFKVEKPKFKAGSEIEIKPVTVIMGYDGAGQVELLNNFIWGDMDTLYVDKHKDVIWPTDIQKKTFDWADSFNISEFSNACKLASYTYAGRSERFHIIVSHFPEADLHPVSHGAISERICESVKETGSHYLINTHSQNFILRIRRMIAEGRFDKNDFALYYIEREDGLSTIKKIDVDEFGSVEGWPKGFFSETLDECIAIRYAEKDRGHNVL